MADKYVREIEEILEGVESKADPDFESSKPRRNDRETRNLIARGFRTRRWEFIKITPKRMILLGILALLLAMILNLVLSQWVSLLVWLGLVLFVVAYGLLFVNRDGSGKDRATRRDRSNRR